MDVALRAHELRWRADGDRTSAEALLANAVRCEHEALTRAAIEALVTLWIDGRDAGAAGVVVAFVRDRAADERLRWAAQIDRLSCTGFADASDRYGEWFAPLARIVGRSPAIQRVRALVAAYARSSEPVLLQGESGVGCSLVAQVLHELSGRKQLSVVYLGAVTAELAAQEIRDATPVDGTLQAAYCEPDDPEGWLTVARSMIAERGARFIITTLRNGRDRWPADLSRCPIAIPALRDRLEDLELLIADLLRRAGHDSGPPPRWLLERLRRQLWGGNVRELQHQLQRASVLGRPGAGGAFDPEAWTHLAGPS